MSTEIRISKDVLVREIQGESVLLDLKSQRYYGLDEVGTRFWLRLAEHSEREAVAAALLAEFDVDRPTLERDLDAFLHRLAEAGLILLVEWDPAVDAS